MSNMSVNRPTVMPTPAPTTPAPTAPVTPVSPTPETTETPRIENSTIPTEPQGEAPPSEEASKDLDKALSDYTPSYHPGSKSAVSLFGSMSGLQDYSKIKLGVSYDTKLGSFAGKDGKLKVGGFGAVSRTEYLDSKGKSKQKDMLHMGAKLGANLKVLGNERNNLFLFSNLSLEGNYTDKKGFGGDVGFETGMGVHLGNTVDLTVSGSSSISQIAGGPAVLPSVGMKIHL